MTRGIRDLVKSRISKERLNTKFFGIESGSCAARYQLRTYNGKNGSEVQFDTIIKSLNHVLLHNITFPSSHINHVILRKRNNNNVTLGKDHSILNIFFFRRASASPKNCRLVCQNE